jgi:hypothetical protein
MSTTPQSRFLLSALMAECKADSEPTPPALGWLQIDLAQIRYVLDLSGCFKQPVVA